MRSVQFVCLLFFAASAVGEAGRPVVALLTDFGLENEAVGLCHGAILKIDSEIAVVDLCHNVQPFNVVQAGMMLSRADTFPTGTVFVAVVDPGVGTDRRAIALKTRAGYYFVAPDNGLLSEVIRRQAIESAFLVNPKQVNPDWKPGTFDGRDLFAPAGAILATSGGDLRRVGTEIDPATVLITEPIRPRVFVEERRIEGHHTRTDTPYGNVWTDIGPEEMKALGIELGDRITVKAGERSWEVPLVVSFGDVPVGEPLAYIDSEGRLAFAINQGNLQAVWGLVEGMTLEVAPVDAVVPVHPSTGSG